MIPPFILNEAADPSHAGDVEIYTSKEDLLYEREVYDCIDQRIHVYDSSGRKLTLVASWGKSFFGNDTFSLEPSSDTDDYTPLVRSLLRQLSVRYGGRPDDVDKLSLSDAMLRMKAAMGMPPRR